MTTTNGWSDGTRRRAGWTALLLLLTGGALGVLMDRLWLLPTKAEASALTADALATHLHLRPSDEARVRALLDSLHTEMTLAAREGPDALITTVRSAHTRLEAALPPEARPAFHSWMQHHRSQMMERLDRGHAPDHAPGHDDGARHDEAHRTQRTGPGALARPLVLKAREHDIMEHAERLVHLQGGVIESDLTQNSLEAVR